MDVKTAKPFGKTSWSFGDDDLCVSSTYTKDYSADAMQKFFTANEVVKRFPKSLRRAKSPMRETQTRSPSIETKTTEPVLSRRHHTAITFGNDNEPKVTAYQEFASQLRGEERRQPCERQKAADIMFTSVPAPICQRSCLSDDFSYFGPNLSQSVYNNRLSDLNNIKQIHTRDSVDATLLGRRRKMLTRSMIDYKHPLESVKGNIKNFMALQISPLVRADSIWSSVNNGGRNSLVTEATVNYGWPHASKGMRRFYKGCDTYNCKIR